jgi:hypothetical protein
MKLKYLLAALNILLLAALGVRAITHNFFSNTFQVEILVSLLLIAGVIAALLWSRTYLMRKGIEDIIEKTQITLITILLVCSSLIIIGINLNYMFSFSSDYQKDIYISDIQPFIKTRGGLLKGEKVAPTGYHVFIEKDGKRERIRFQQFSNFEVWKNQNVILNFRKGLLGFEVFIPKPLEK